MSSSPYEFTPNPNLPSNDDIIALCETLGELPGGTTISDPSNNSVIAWVKYGPNVTVGEAQMQHWTAIALREAGVSDVQAAPVFRAFNGEWHGRSVGYIVMQYFEGADCDSNDADLVAGAFKALTSLQVPPTATLGYFGNGTRTIVHSFFPEWFPNADYRSDQDFYDHIRNICRHLRIDFRCDLSKCDRLLCLSDFNPANFRKTTTADGRSVVAVLDFRATCFMPLPFVEVALIKNRDTFRYALIQKLEEIGYPRGPRHDVQALHHASNRLVQYGFAPVALPSGVNRIISESIR
ncbi:hypothetical protein CYLTODRAFT_384531 [Cylindrobasidium torrendii FP15055 ss-10]|uniref:Aminoglycoside phosphotransferase domain-containing protein n=1 Tax=Cylindrobasidium torrendii FP15055 ss-10 TaxID=1314674 RepID=A0A0D7ATN0_9AGAR|nr:hypothetical protein CYLTODRAFT_384531 [Cylindrobasidium torrendii FP15055 ss-10]